LNTYSIVSIIICITIVFIFFFTGTGKTYTPIERPAIETKNLDLYLSESEGQYDDIKPDVEKKIIWFDEPNTKTEISIIYLHGFSASRQEVSPLTENIAKLLSANVFLTRLTGHGRSGEAMGSLSVEELLADTVEAFDIGKKIGNRVLVIGMSTGSTLATWLAVKAQSEQLAGLVLLSPNYGLVDPKSNWLLKPGARYWLPLVEGRTYHFSPDNELQAKYWSWKYPTVALIPMMVLVNYVTELPLKSITAPVLVLYSDTDKIVDIKKTRKIYDRIGSGIKEIGVIKDTQGSQHHVLAGDVLSPATTLEVESRIISFVKNL